MEISPFNIEATHPVASGRGREFLRFVAAHERELRRALRKNVTYDPEIFDDVFAATIVKVHDAIVAGRDVRDYRQYFFVAAKWEYINRDNRQRRARQRELPISAAVDEAERSGLTADCRPLLSAIRHRVGCRFGRVARKVWEAHRSGERLTDIGRRMMANPRRLSALVREIDHFVATDKRIQQIKKTFYDYADTE